MALSYLDCFMHPHPYYGQLPDSLHPACTNTYRTVHLLPLLIFFQALLWFFKVNLKHFRAVYLLSSLGACCLYRFLSRLHEHLPPLSPVDSLSVLVSCAHHTPHSVYNSTRRVFTSPPWDTNTQVLGSHDSFPRSFSVSSGV